MPSDPTATAARQAEPWAVRSGNPHGWVWIQDGRWTRLRRALWCRRFHRWKQNDDGDWYRTRRYCFVCAVKSRAMPDTAAPPTT